MKSCYIRPIIYRGYTALGVDPLPNPVECAILVWNWGKYLGEEALLDKHLSFDMCRWTCALSDWQSDVDHEKIRQKLGISKIQWREIHMKLRRLAGGE
jgi:hypothetical protein